MADSGVIALVAQLDTSGDVAAEEVIAQLVEVGKPAVPELIRAAKNKAQPLRKSPIFSKKKAVVSEATRFKSSWS